MSDKTLGYRCDLLFSAELVTGAEQSLAFTSGLVDVSVVGLRVTVTGDETTGYRFLV